MVVISLNSSLYWYKWKTIIFKKTVGSYSELSSVVSFILVPLTDFWSLVLNFFPALVNLSYSVYAQSSQSEEWKWKNCVVREALPEDSEDPPCPCPLLQMFI